MRSALDELIESARSLCDTLTDVLQRRFGEDDDGELRRLAKGEYHHFREEFFAKYPEMHVLGVRAKKVLLRAARQHGLVTWDQLKNFVESGHILEVRECGVTTLNQLQTFFSEQGDDQLRRS